MLQTMGVLVQAKSVNHILSIINKRTCTFLGRSSKHETIRNKKNLRILEMEKVMELLAGKNNQADYLTLRYHQTHLKQTYYCYPRPICGLLSALGSGCCVFETLFTIVEIYTIDLNMLIN